MAKSIYKEIADEINMTKKWIAKRTAVYMHNALITAYNLCIEQFYSYIPKNKSSAYVRHGMTRGNVGEGKNLYKALISRLDSIDKMMPSDTSYQGGVDFNPQKMSSNRYRLPSFCSETTWDSDYDGYQQPENVFEAVMSGIRFPQINGAMKTTLMTFTCEISIYNFHYIGSPYEILTSITEDARLASYFIALATDDAKKELELKYTDIE